MKLESPMSDERQEGRDQQTNEQEEFYNQLQPSMPIAQESELSPVLETGTNFLGETK